MPQDSVLLTPGPLSIARKTREAMLKDWGSWDSDFNQITGRIRQNILNIAHASETHECVPMQGSGTFSVEAAIGTLVPKNGHVLIPNNGAYCARMVRMCTILNRRVTQKDYADDTAVSAHDVDSWLTQDPSITHVALVYCETSAGILNPLEDIAEVVARHGKRLIIDAMSAFGALPLDARKIQFDAAIAASGKCLEGPPGMGFVVVRKEALLASQGNCHSLALDLYDQWVYMQKTTQWRYTPPTHVVAALDCAITDYLASGGRETRLKTYEHNCRELIAGMRDLGLKPFLPASIQAPIIVTFHAPSSPNYQFKAFYDAVKAKGYILYPGKLTQLETFRVGCMGQLGSSGMRGAVDAIGEVLSTL